MGDAKEVLSGFPAQIKGTFGFSLRRIQQGLNPQCDSRRMDSIGKGVWELKAADERTWYRVVYLTRIGNTIYVLHAFEKRSRKTDKRDLEIARARLKTIHKTLRSDTESTNA
jgi:phage-related protein